MFDFIKKIFGSVSNSAYASHPEAVVISCYYNPKNNPARLAAFNRFYPTIRHLNHRIIECSNGEYQLPTNENISRIQTQSTLWHKEQLLNMIIAKLPSKFKYVFWVDADVLFTNPNWLVDGVEQLRKNNLVQLFEYCVHLERGQANMPEGLDNARRIVNQPQQNRRVWKSYASNYAQHLPAAASQNYDIRGHIGFAWGAKLSTLQQVPLYDRALIGGADGIIAYSGTGQLENLDNIKEMFGEVLEDVYSWGKTWHAAISGKVGFVKGDLLHLWHGDLADRQYYRRIKEFAPHINNIRERDINGLYITHDYYANQYMNSYFDQREPAYDSQSQSHSSTSHATQNLTSQNVLSNEIAAMEAAAAMDVEAGIESAGIEAGDSPIADNPGSESYS